MLQRATRCLVGPVLVLGLLGELGMADGLSFRQRCLDALVRAVPGFLASQDQRTGRFGRGIWIVTDQNVIYPLAVAWALEHPSNPYHRSDRVLQAVMAGGDALIDAQDEAGQWVFRKKDGSTWGKTYMPWTYSRWIRTYGLIRDAMPPERRKRWEAGLRLGYEGIASQALGKVHNIPAHHAMGLYLAGRLLDRPGWCRQARAFMAEVVRAQDAGGYWSEHCGPVVRYNFVYTEALGIYLAVSGDESVLPALRRAAVFHANFTYPDGSPVETIDERTAYRPGVLPGNVGFCMTDTGRALLRHQLALLDEGSLSADTAASFLLYGREGPLAEGLFRRKHDFVLGRGDAAVRRRGPWFLCASAFVCPVSNSRWIQDRQNFVSVFHEAVGLIVGGGNTKLQPRWSSFTVGAVDAMHHRPGDENPDFQPPEGLRHVPTEAKLAVDGDQFGVDLAYGSQRCAIRLQIVNDRSVMCLYRAEGPCQRPVAAHLTVVPRFGQPVRSQTGRCETIGQSAFVWGPGQAGAWIEHAQVRIGLPPAAEVRWPVLPHNPYRKDGRAEPREGRLVIDLPFGPGGGQYRVSIAIR